MSDPLDSVSEPKLPWHFWLVSVVAVIWNSFGVFDFVMSLARGDAYMRSMGMTGPQIEYFHQMPPWTYGAWALGTLGAGLGTILLLMRSRRALPVFVASLIGLLLSLVYAYFLSNGSEVMGPAGSAMWALVAGGCLFFVWYAWLATKKGILR